jgi:hypothetical protein
LFASVVVPAQVPAQASFRLFKYQTQEWYVLFAARKQSCFNGFAEVQLVQILRPPGASGRMASLSECA